jgi:signal transduction histidine kinase
MTLKKMNYASAVSFVASMAIFVVTLSDHTRVAPSLFNYFITCKSLCIFFNFCFGVYFYRHEVTDKSASLYILSLIFFFLSMMWFLPMYEIAYIQCALLAAFLRYKRSWIFPTMFFLAFLAMIATYEIQERLQWTLPAISRMDWIFTVMVFFLLSWCIQKFAIHSQTLERDRLLRFSIIGKETTRVIHDLKGLLSSPLLILESLKNKNQPLSPEFHERQMSLLMQDMDNVRETIKGIHRLVVHEDQIARVDLSEVIQGSMQVLERRLAAIEIKLPENSFVFGKRDRLHSVFFNLFLNSLEAFERQASNECKKIEIFWRDKTLIFQDNAGGILTEAGRSTKGLGSGLGLELVRNDLMQMNARFKLSSAPPYTVAEISFGE